MKQSTRINYTGRRRITRDKVRLRLVPADAQVSLYADVIDLSGIPLPEDARIILEAQRQTRFMRLDAGTVAAPDLPAGVRLTEFDGHEGVQFRVKVVGTSDDNTGKIVAAADGITAESEGAGTGRTSLLPIQAADLGHRIWKLELEDRPVLLINRDVGDWNQLAREPHFQALVFPEVLRQIGIWLIDNWDAIDDDTPLGDWRTFFQDFGNGMDDIPDEEEIRREWAADWADSITAKFCRRHRLLAALVAAEGIG